jgi:hypothetical protein
MSHRTGIVPVTVEGQPHSLLKRCIDTPRRVDAGLGRSR